MRKDRITDKTAKLEGPDGIPHCSYFCPYLNLQPKIGRKTY